MNFKLVPREFGDYYLARWLRVSDLTWWEGCFTSGFLPQNHNCIRIMRQASDKSKLRVIRQNTCLDLLRTLGPGKQGQSEIRAQPRGGERDMATACSEVPWLGSRKEKNRPGKINKTAIKCSIQFGWIIFWTLDNYVEVSCLFVWFPNLLTIEY